MVESLKNVPKSGRLTLLSTQGLSARLFFKEIRLFSFTIFTFLTFTTLLPTTEAATPANGTEFAWKNLVPSPNLNWVNCKPNRECARLEVPLDYSAPNGDKAAVALIRIKSKIPPSSKNYRGPVLFNPGGPGASGVLFIDQEGDRFQKVLGDGYDIVGFDPRGIGQTTPGASVFSDAAERAAWEAGTPPLINSTKGALPQSFARALVLNQQVEARNKDAAQHASTAVVARDMLTIVKAYGRDRLQYWGFSYGSLLGAVNSVIKIHLQGLQPLRVLHPRRLLLGRKSDVS